MRSALLELPELPEARPVSLAQRAIGYGRQSEDLVRFVNAVLERLKADGTWTTLQREWLAPVIGPADPPVPQYKPE